MGMPSPIELALILGIVIMLFGTKRIRTIGQDIGEAITGFKKGLAWSKDGVEILEDEKKDITELNKRT